jgi:hypothetical protein
MSSQNLGLLNRVAAERPFFAAALGALAILAVGCSTVAPTVGPWRVENEDDATDAAVSDADNTVQPGEVSFKLQIRPLLANGSRDMPKGCKGCHYRTEANHTGVDLSGLDLSTLGSLRKGGGSSGKRIVIPGKPNDSVLIQALKGRYQFSGQMPKNGPFWNESDQDYIGLVETWITEGAKGADDE